MNTTLASSPRYRGLPSLTQSPRRARMPPSQTRAANRGKKMYGPKTAIGSASAAKHGGGVLVLELALALALETV
jgi:hypothetical protein